MTAFESDIILALAAEFSLCVECRAEKIQVKGGWNGHPCSITIRAPRVEWVGRSGRWDVAVVGDELVVGGWKRFTLADPGLVDQVRQFLEV